MSRGFQRGYRKDRRNCWTSSRCPLACENSCARISRVGKVSPSTSEPVTQTHVWKRDEIIRGRLAEFCVKASRKPPESPRGNGIFCALINILPTEEIVWYFTMCNCELSSFHNVPLKPPVVRVETQVLRQCDKMSLCVGIIYRFYIFFEIKSRSLFIFFFIFQYLTPASRFMRRSNVYILHTRMSNIVIVYHISSFFFQVESRFTDTINL